MKTKDINFAIKSIVALILMILLCVVYSFILNLRTEDSKLKELLSTVQKDVYANLEEYTIYGNHLNINGYIKKSEIEDLDVQKIRVVIKSENGYYSEQNAVLSEDDTNYLFTLSSNINEGIDLEEYTEEDTYFVFVKISGNTKDGNYTEKIYSVNNMSDCTGNEYYTLTKNGKNNKIDVSFKSVENIDVMELISYETVLPDEVYDIVLDAGHGGRDPGAMYGEYKESEFTLEYVIALKAKLEELGYKVKLTRDEDEYVEAYGQNSRSSTSFETKAKLVLSIHLNSSYYDENEGGVEVYAPNHANLEFAKNLADNIVSMAQTCYSVNSSMRVYDGVYVRTFTQQEIDDFRQEAEDVGYTFYESITTDTNYLFMIRETGGKITGAYTDGRDEEGNNNEYIDSNIAAEAYLLELGFINSSADVERLTKNKDEYINAIVKSIVENYS